MNLANKSYHFIGIGGIGMCGLAELFAKLGAKVSGSDPAKNKQVQHLQDLGIQISDKHREENIGDVDVIVYSSAIPQDHIEMLAAKKKMIPRITRAEALSELMRLKRGVAVTGTHGKTTTSSLLTSVFFAAQQDPAAVIGGRLKTLGSTAGWGEGPWMIAEADESDGSFMRLNPEVVVITNIDDDHLDFHGSVEGLKKSFYEFAAQVPFYGFVLACGDDEKIRESFKGFHKRILYYGFDSSNDYVIKKEKEGFYLFCEEKKVAKISPPLPGRHNVLNSAAALSVAHELGLPMDFAEVGIEEFSGVGRRAEWKGRNGEIDIYDDYAHHPTEIEVTIKGFREKFPERPLTICFQPHRYTRTQNCWKQFKKVFSEASEIWITDVYAAGEEPIEGYSGEDLCKSITDAGHRKCIYVSREELKERKRFNQLATNSLFVTMGAGDVWKAGEAFVAT